MRIPRMQFLLPRFGRRFFPVVLTQALLLTLAASSGGRAEEPPVFAISNARIVTLSGPPIEKGTVVVRNGVIAAVGALVEIPGDARLIDCTGMNVYPGIIDALSDVGIEEARPQTSSSPPAPRVPGAPPSEAAAQQPAQSPDERQGLTPYRQAAEMLNPANRKIEAARNAGITTALVVPRGGIFPGQSSLVNLSGGEPGHMIVKTPVAFHIMLTGGRGFGGNFPGSLMGAFAFVKQTLLDAGQYAAAWSVYNANPGVARPDFSRALESLQPLVNRQSRAVLTADNPVDIQRALDLAEAYKFDLILAGAAESAKIAPALKERNIPVLLSVKFPEKERDADPEAKEELRELRRRVEAPANAAALNRAGVRFAFQSGDTANPKDFIRNVGKAVEAGLDKDAALRALTINAAEILGVADRMGSVEKNKTANLIVTTGDIFDPATKIKLVFIDGRKFEITEPAKGQDAKPASDNSESVAGTWSLTVNSPQGAVSVTMTLQQSGPSVSGTVSSPIGDATIENGDFTGGKLTFRTTVGGMNVSFSGTVRGSSIAGTMNVSDMGTMECTGTRSPRVMSDERVAGYEN